MVVIGKFTGLNISSCRNVPENKSTARSAENGHSTEKKETQHRATLGLPIMGKSYEVVRVLGS